MAEEAESIQVKILANITGLIDGMAKSTSTVKEATGQMQGAFGSLSETIENMKAPFLAITALLAGGKMFKEIIGETIGWTGEVAKLARQLGISTEAASGLAMALGKLGIDTNTYGTAVFKLQMQMRQGEDELNRNGIATRNSAKEMLPVQDVMLNTIKRMKEMKGGYDANALSILAFGRAAKELQGLMRLTTERISEGEAEAKKLGMTVTKDGVTSMRAYKESTHEAGLVFEAMQIQIGNKLLPILTELGLWFAHYGPAMITPVVGAFKAMAAVLSSSTVQVLLLGAGLRMTLIPAFMALLPAIRTFALTVAIAGPIEGTAIAIQLLGASINTMLGPVGWAVLAVAALGMGLERWTSSASRAAEADAELTKSIQSKHNEFTRLTAELTDSDDAMTKATKGSEEYKAAAEKKSIVIAQLSNLYPGFNKFLVDEAGNERSIAEALRLANMERKKAIEYQIAQTRATLDANKAKQANLAVTAAVGGAYGILGSIWGGIAGKRADDMDQAIKTQTDSLNRLLDTLKGVNGEMQAGAGGKDRFKPKDEKDEKKNANPVAAFEQELEKKKAMLAQADGDLAKMSEDSERAFWAVKLDLTKKGSDDWVKIRLKMAALGQASDRKATAATEKRIKEENDFIDKAMKDLQKQQDDAREKSREMAKLEKEDKIAAAREALAAEREMLDHGVAMGRISNAQKLAAETIFRAKERDLERKALSEEQAQYAKGTAEWQKLENKKVDVARKAENDIRKLENQAQEQRMEKWKSFFGSMTGGFDSAIKGLIKGTMTWGDAFKEVLSSALDGLISFFVQWGIQEAIKWAASLVIGDAGRTAEAAGAAAVYSVNAMASVAAIPYVGWAMAPGVGAAAYGSGLAMAGLASAAGGWDNVPGDQLAQIHKNEMVMSAPLAEGLRGIIANGQAGGQKGGDTYVIHANDAKSFMDMFKRNATGIMKHTNELARNGRKS